MCQAVCDLKRKWENVDCNLQNAIGSMQSVRSEIQTRLNDLDTTRADLELERLQISKGKVALKEEAEEVNNMKAQLEQEKAKMVKSGIGNNDLIGLNFGGEHVITVKRSLLLQCENSMLARMFSGRYEDQLDRDKDGNVFFDYSPKVMMPLIEYLRLRRDAAPEESPSLPVVEESQQKAWLSMLRFFELLEEPPCTSFSGIKVDVNISELKGWTMFFCKPYSHHTNMKDFVPPEHLKGSCLLVGARETGKKVLKLAAMGRADIVTKLRQLNQTELHNGVHWYACNASGSKSVGFSPNETISQNNADNADMSSPTRLSWHLNGHGGWRAGDVTGLSQSSEWEKVIFVGNAMLDNCN